jgi:glycosyltransferase involved in cell wall biosynthesis
MSNFTILIPYFNGEDNIVKLLNSIPDGIPVLIVDDMSDRPLNLEAPNCRVVHMPRKGYFSGAVNEGLKKISGDVLVLNQDVWFEGVSWLNFIDEHVKEHAFFGEKVAGFNPIWAKGYVQGTFMYMRSDAIRKVGLLDEKNYPLWGATAEWQLRACRKGFSVKAVRPIPGFRHDRQGEYGHSIREILAREPEKKNLFIRTPPLVSVIVPCYNYGKYLPDLVNSFIGGNTSLGFSPGQTLQSFEIILVDDCSTDGESEKIARSLADSQKGIFFYQTVVNGGTSAARNHGISKSHAHIVTSIDADDMRESSSLELMYDAQRKNQHSFIYDDVVLFSKGKRNPKVWEMPEYDFDKLIYKNQIHCGIMFPYEAWKESGGYPEQMSNGRDDWAFNVALGIVGYCGFHVKNPGYLYRREGQNRTLINTSPNWMSKFQEKMRKLFPAIYKGEYPMGCCGGRRSASMKAGARNSPASSKNMVVGAEGMSILVYQSGSSANKSFYGPVTGTRYVFSSTKNRKLVDNRDLHFKDASRRDIGLLDLLDHGKPLFKVEKPKSIEPVKDVVEEPVKCDLYDTPLDVETVEYMIDHGYDSVDKFIKETNKALREKLEWDASEVKMVKDALKEWKSTLE